MTHILQLLFIFHTNTNGVLHLLFIQSRKAKLDEDGKSAEVRTNSYVSVCVRYKYNFTTDESPKPQLDATFHVDSHVQVHSTLLFSVTKFSML